MFELEVSIRNAGWSCSNQAQRSSLVEARKSTRALISDFCPEYLGKSVLLFARWVGSESRVHLQRGVDTGHEFTERDVGIGASLERKVQALVGND